MSPGMLYFIIHLRDRTAAQTVVDIVVQEMEQLQADGALENQIQTALDSAPTDEEEEQNMPMFIFMRYVYLSKYYAGDLSHSYKTNIPNRFQCGYYQVLIEEVFALPLQ
ncbi:uncharacterized protein LOC129871733 [Solanum dulcamara]|uniref:uncharacterized protein LOC129871733 n=1 Tax=Solanum dulcamara TaxID=45834 RepID=UPI00248630EC|nr:uncharacterized protein LOC129871733 [Solanum dulcamara]